MTKWEPEHERFDRDAGHDPGRVLIGMNLTLLHTEHDTRSMTPEHEHDPEHDAGT